MANTSVLLIAPSKSPGLAALPWVDAEIQSIVNSGLNIRLERDVSERTLLELLSNKNYNIIWFASHGSKEGLYLSDGLISVDALASMLKSCTANYVVLNTCDSVHIAAVISEETGMDVICTVSNVEDRTAWRTAALFATNLARAESVYSAYQRARPTQAGKYIYLPGNRNGVVARIVEAAGEPTVLDLVIRIDRIEPIVLENQEKIAENRNEIVVIKRKLSPPRSAIVWAIAALIVLIANIVAIFTVINSEELGTVALRQPSVFVFGEIMLLLVTFTWLRQAVLIVRNTNDER